MKKIIIGRIKFSKIILFIIVLLLIIISVIKFSHEIQSSKKYSAQKIYSIISRQADILELCEKNGFIKINDCQEFINYSDSLKKKEFHFFNSNDKILVGVDFSREVVILMDLKTSQKTINSVGKWNCFGYPLQVLPKSCTFIDFKSKNNLPS